MAMSNNQMVWFEMNSASHTMILGLNWNVQARNAKEYHQHVFVCKYDTSK